MLHSEKLPSDTTNIVKIIKNSHSWQIWEARKMKMIILFRTFFVQSNSRLPIQNVETSDRFNSLLSLSSLGKNVSWKLLFKLKPFVTDADLWALMKPIKKGPSMSVSRAEGHLAYMGSIYSLTLPANYVDLRFTLKFLFEIIKWEENISAALLKPSLLHN